MRSRASTAISTALDGRTRLLYVTHGSAVEILNVDTGVKSEPITGLSGVHGVAFAYDKDRGYVSNGRGNSFLATAESGPAPAPTKEQPRPRPTILPGSFMVLEFGK